MYGVITVTALIIVTGRYDITASAVFLKVLLAVVVFWVAHFFANVVAHLSEAPDGAPDFKESFKYAMSHSVGLLALFGFLGSRSWTRKLHYRFGAALVTTLLGVGIVILNAFIH